LEGGVFAQLARASRGLISVNSTAAYAALGFGVPVKLLGRAVFDIEGLTDPKPLESFWLSPTAPDLDLFTRFRRRLSIRTQVYGSFHNPRNLSGTAKRLVERLIVLDKAATHGQGWGRRNAAAFANDTENSFAESLSGAGR
jgi:capsular polysaccharide export protein